MAANRCTVCAHPSRYDIDSLLVQGVAKRAVADKYGLGRMAVSRHAESHVPALMGSIAKELERLSASSLLVGTMDLYERACRLLDEAEHADDFDGRVKALESVRRVTETLAKVAIAANTESDRHGQAEAAEHRFDLDAAIMEQVKPTVPQRVDGRVDAVLPALEPGKG